MAKKRIITKRRKKALKHTALAFVAAFAVVVGVITLAAALLHFMGLSHSIDEIAIIDNATEKLSVTEDASIAALAAETENAEETYYTLGTETEGTEAVETNVTAGLLTIQSTGQTVTLETDDDTYTADNILLINRNTGDIILQKAPTDTIVPTALTKVMTALVAAETLNITDSSDAALEETVKIPSSTLKYCKKKELSTVGFEKGDKVTVKDLFYGTIVPAGADAAYQLALRISESTEEFAALMNQKAAELGLSEATSFTDPIGLYDENQTSSAEDMALIMNAAMNNSFVAEILATGTYKTSNGVTFKSKVRSRLKKNLDGDSILGSKSGYIKKAGGCCMVCYQGKSGAQYILVLARATNSKVVVSEAAAILEKYAE